MIGHRCAVDSCTVDYKLQVAIVNIFISKVDHVTSYVRKIYRVVLVFQSIISTFQSFENCCSVPKQQTDQVST